MHVFFSVGEPSGDDHAAKLIEEIRRRDPSARFSGFGGPKMRQTGCQLLFELTTMAVMGVLAVIPLLWKFYRLVKQAERYLRDHRPDVVVLVDFPGFNWWIARKAKRLGITVVYYMPPQLWAWASWRVHRMHKYVDFVLSPLEFETKWFRQQGVDAQFVGHPFFDEASQRPLDREFVDLQLDKPGFRVGVLPGSRNHEVRRNWPIQLAAIRQLHESHPESHVLVACYNEQHRQWCREYLLSSGGGNLPVELCVGQTPEVIEAADVCLIVSGSVSLEVLARETPSVVLYACSHALYWFGKAFIHCDYFTLANLIAEREVMPEFAVVGNPQADIERMAKILRGWLDNPTVRSDSAAELKEVARTAAQSGCSAKAADAILSITSPSTQGPHRLPRAA